MFDGCDVGFVYRSTYICMQKEYVKCCDTVTCPYNKIAISDPLIAKHFKNQQFVGKMSNELCFFNKL